MGDVSDEELRWQNHVNGSIVPILSESVRGVHAVGFSYNKKSGAVHLPRFFMFL